MTLQWPWALLLALVPLYEAWRRRRIGAQGFPAIRKGVLQRRRMRFDERPRLPGGWRTALAWLLLVFALARPQWGQAPTPLYAPSGRLLIALDLSRSMLAADTAPTRLERARMLATRLAQDLPERRIGLLGFAATAHVLVPPSRDHELLRIFLDSLSPSDLLDQGTRYGPLLDTALDTFGDAGQDDWLVLLSDGESEDSDWQRRLPELRRRGVRVLAVALGTANGSRIEQAPGSWIEDAQGKPVVTRLHDENLKQWADASRGRRIAADDATATQAWRALLSRTGLSRVYQPRPAERFAGFLAAGLALLAWAMLVEWPASRTRPLSHRSLRPGADVAVAGLLLPLLYAGIALGHSDGRDLLAPAETQLRQMLARPRPTAGDYRGFASTVAEYGLDQRTHALPISEPLLRDALAATEAGQRLDPSLDWTALQRRLHRLLEPPPPVPAEDPRPTDPANSPIEARQASSGNAAHTAGEHNDADEHAAPSPGQATHPASGTGQQATEWGDPSLAQPARELERLRAAGSPVELLKALQRQQTDDMQSRTQTW